MKKTLYIMYMCDNCGEWTKHYVKDMKKKLKEFVCGQCNKVNDVAGKNLNKEE